MSYLRWTLAACIFVLVGVNSVNQADEPQFMPRPGVLVLRTGRVLRGDIVRVGDRYVVALSQQDEIGVPADQVQWQCDSLEDAYVRQRGMLPTKAKVADHLKLANWCLRYNLMTAAAEQLMAAQRCDPHDPENEHFEKRLRFAAQRPTTPPVRSEATEQFVTQKELDELTRSLPHGSVEQFTNTIQPLLINRCGASSCHGPNSDSSFRLVYPNWSRTLPRRFTQRNLQTTLSLLDRGQPDRSPLLVMSALAHGGSKKPSLSEEDVEQLQHLAGWIFRSLGDTSRSAPAALNVPDALLLQPGDRAAATASDTGSLSGGKGPHPERLAYPASGQIDSAVRPASHAAQVTVGEGDGSAAGKDPFDPEIFNRRYLGGSR